MVTYQVRVTAAEAAHVLDVPLSELLDLIAWGELDSAGEYPDQTLDLAAVELYAATRWSTRRRADRRSPFTYFVSVSGAAEILGVSRQRVKQLTAAGRLPHLVTSWGDRLYRREQLEVVANAREARNLQHGGAPSEQSKQEGGSRPVAAPRGPRREAVTEAELGTCADSGRGRPAPGAPAPR